MSGRRRFDDWPKRYDRWFETPVGRAVLKYELDLVLDLLRPEPGERILDAGSGTGIFTRGFLSRGAKVIGLDISFAMVAYAREQTSIRACPGVVGDMTALPFAEGAFDKSVSVTALEFVADEKRAVAELFRVTRSGGAVVVATLNSLSPWAARRAANARRDPESIFNGVFFRSPLQLLAAAPVPGTVRTAIQFGKMDDPETFDVSERQAEGLETGAFVAAQWFKP